MAKEASAHAARTARSFMAELPPASVLSDGLVKEATGPGMGGSGPSWFLSAVVAEISSVYVVLGILSVLVSTHI